MIKNSPLLKQAERLSGTTGRTSAEHVFEWIDDMLAFGGQTRRPVIPAAESAHVRHLIHQVGQMKRLEGLAKDGDA